MLVVRATQTGFPGGPGYTDFHFEEVLLKPAATQADADAAASAVKTFWATIKTRFPPVWQVDTDPTVREVSLITGALQTLWTVANPGSYVGTGTAPFAAPCGGLVQWHTRTPGLHGFMRGRTFLVPWSVENYGPDGKIAGGVSATVLSAANGLLNPLPGGQRLVVWHRPKALLGGYGGKIETATMSPLAVVLTSRRA